MTLKQTGLFLLFSFLSLTTLDANSSQFLSETKQALPQQEWNREIIGGGKPISCKFINYSGAISVILIAERSYKALFSGNRADIVREDIIFYKESPNGMVEDKIMIPKQGKYWFIIKNDTQANSKITLDCANT